LIETKFREYPQLKVQTLIFKNPDMERWKGAWGDPGGRGERRGL